MTSGTKKRTADVKVTRLAGTASARAGLADLMSNISYEVMSFKRTEQDVTTHVPLDIPITITVTEAKGIDATLDLSERLAAHGYYVNPHLPARQIRDKSELTDIVDRMLESGINRAFVIGGDAPEPAGEFSDAVSLLHALDELGRPLKDVGISGYPEGHANISDEALEEAMKSKAPYASRIVTQMCFSADVITQWSQTLTAQGVSTPVIVGMPGPVSRQKLIRISAGIGLGQSARFLQKQRGLVWRFMSPGGFSPNRLLRNLAVLAPENRNIQGIRIFTFNEIAGTEAWRQRLVESLPPRSREPIKPQDHASSQ